MSQFSSPPRSVLISQNGHVMLVGAVDRAAGQLTVIEGNHSKTTGPTGKRRDGVGKRVFQIGDPYLCFCVRPSDVDFDQRYLYFATRPQAESRRALLQAKGMLHG